MHVSQILELLPDSILQELALETKVNKYSKKLQGQVLFKLLIHCIISFKDNSLRTMESAYESIAFKLLNDDAGDDKNQIRYSSISERLSTIKVDYFEKLYTTCVKIYGKRIGNHNAAVASFDSTIVTLSSQLLKVGYRLKGDAQQIRQLKFTIGLSEIPMAVHLFTEQKHTSENVTLKEAILQYQPTKSNVVRVFDKGVNSRKTYDELTEKKIPFISRIIPSSKYELYEKNTLKRPVHTTSLCIYADCWVYLFSEQGRANLPIRCIRTSHKQTNEQITFITNITDLTSEQITELYKRRWEIEVFFKFLKQELNFSHLINRSENGIRVMLYTTLIASILLLVYKKENQLSGYKIMKLKFCQELEKLIVRDIVILCKGNIQLFNKYFGDAPP